MSALVAQAQQQLVVLPSLDTLQRLDLHAEQLETPFLERGIDARGPLHLAAAAHELDVVLGEAVDAVTAAFLGGSAGAVGSGKH